MYTCSSTLVLLSIVDFLVLNNQQDISLDGKPSYHISQRVILCTKPGVIVSCPVEAKK